ncbi:type III secretion system (T3SS) SseB-like protein [Roseimicrobium gellanilyticum]|uniref:Type III secretion system (T3SS) SseB-like protein n=1 Tax=Roseimicrobium gellanilyticum TaxID=748857 RepID=A0A366H2D5_9BACT|nr:SseB family protein [Roseimicrobium gellanilyticum]RBP35711.1 type III secretion system (T3SS) SseB-like protein [Roseimicrobium gellanilyticum]
MRWCWTRHPPHQFVLSGGRVKALAAMAHAVQVEQALQRLRSGESHAGDLQLVAKYPDYVIAIAKSSGGDMALCHAPDADGRTLAAVFTHNDAADLALGKMQAHYAPSQVVTLKSAGPQLFRMLAGMQNLDGLVFNFEGPGNAIAFAAGISEILLAEAEK